MKKHFLLITASLLAHLAAMADGSWEKSAAPVTSITSGKEYIIDIHGQTGQTFSLKDDGTYGLGATFDGSDAFVWTLTAVDDNGGYTLQNLSTSRYLQPMQHTSRVTTATGSATLTVRHRSGNDYEIYSTYTDTNGTAYNTYFDGTYGGQNATGWGNSGQQKTTGGGSSQLIQLYTASTPAPIVYDIYSAGLPEGVRVFVKGEEVEAADAWTVGNPCEVTGTLTVSDVKVTGLGGGRIYSVSVDNINHQVSIDVVDLFVPATDTNDDSHVYLLKDGSNRYAYKNSSNNLWHTTSKDAASRFIFLVTDTEGQYNIYDKTNNVYYYWTQNTGVVPGTKTTANSSVKYQATLPQGDGGRWTFDGAGHIMPVTQSSASDPYGWNFTGGDGNPLNLWKTSDSNSVWSIIDPNAATLDCAVTMFALPGKPYMHKLVPEEGDVITGVTFDEKLTAAGFEFCEDRKTKGNRYVYVRGTAPTEEGVYTYNVQTANGVSKVTLTVDSYLGAPTPTMGWLSWNWFESWAENDVLLENAAAMKKRGLVDAGYKYFILDDKWAVSRTNGATKANLDYDRAKFPDMNAFNDRMHEMGFYTGVYSDAGSWTCAARYQPGSYGYEKEHMVKFNQWDFDMLKYDFCNNEASAQISYPPMGKAIREINKVRRDAGNPRPFAFNICEWGQNQPWKWGAEAGGNTWRCTYDSREAWMGGVGQGSNLIGVLDGSDTMKPLWKYAGVNRFNDADMMMIGLHGCGASSNHTPTHGSNGGGNLSDAFTPAQARSQMSIWSMLASPLTMCADFRDNPESRDNPTAVLPDPLITNDDLFTLTNPLIVAINQDVLGQQAEFMQELSTSTIGSRTGRDVYVKDLEGGDIALAVFNRDANSKMGNVDIRFADIYLESGQQYYVKDVWTGKVQQLTDVVRTGEIDKAETKVYRISKNPLEEGFGSYTVPGQEPAIVPTLIGYAPQTPISTPDELKSGKYFVSVYTKNQEGLLAGNDYKNVSTETVASTSPLDALYVWTVQVSDEDNTFTLTNSSGRTFSVQGLRNVGRNNIFYTDENGGSYEQARLTLLDTEEQGAVVINDVSHWMVHQQYTMDKSASYDIAYIHANGDTRGIGSDQLRLSYFEKYNKDLANTCAKLAFYPAKSVFDFDPTISTLTNVIDYAGKGEATLDDVTYVRDIILE